MEFKGEPTCSVYRGNSSSVHWGARGSNARQELIGAYEWFKGSFVI